MLSKLYPQLEVSVKSTPANFKYNHICSVLVLAITEVKNNIRLSVGVGGGRVKNETVIAIYLIFPIFYKASICALNWKMNCTIGAGRRLGNFFILT